ncbi:MAG: urease accessory protein UreE [Beijerinckiaceae bacterium]
MLRATKAGHFHAATADTVVLDHEERARRRGMVKTVGGLDVLVDLAEAPRIDRGDSYVLEDGRLIEIVAAAEPLMEARSADPLHMTRIAYHIGNRHLECEIAKGRIRLRRDHVIADMLTGLGAKVTEIEAPFHPEGGAYHPGGHGHEAKAHHDHAHNDHDHGHEDHGHEDHGHGHVHGPGCGHDH